MLHLPASHPHRIQVGDQRWQVLSVGWAVPTPLTRPVLVEVRQVGAQHGEQMWGVVDQGPV
jgi:hypothetical protein